MNLIDIVKTEGNKDKITALILKYRIFEKIDDEEFIKRYEKIENFTKKYNDLDFKEINKKFKDEFKDELLKDKIYELDILKEIIQKIYLKNKQIILNELEEVNELSKNVLEKVISNIDYKNINVKEKKSNRVDEIRTTHKPIINRAEKKQKEKEEKEKIEILLDDLNFSNEFEIRKFLKDRTDYKNIYNNFIKNKISDKIKEKIKKIGLDNFLKLEEIDKDKIVIQFIKYFEEHSFIEFLKKVLKDDRFCYKYINKLKEYIDSENIKISLNIKNPTLNYSDETFELEEFKKIILIKNEEDYFVNIANYLIDEDEFIEEILFDIINYFTNINEIETIYNNYFSLEENKERYERMYKK